jgi:aldehyde dehydrogenase (NAD+)
MNNESCYIGGKWIPSASAATRPVVDPATEQQIGNVAVGSEIDVDKAVQSASEAFASFSNTTPQQRIELLGCVLEQYQQRFEDIAQSIRAEVGCPITLSRGLQAQTGLIHLQTYGAILANYDFGKDAGSTRVEREPIGVCGLITPWNWPINQLCVKIVPALAAGCTVVVKPSEVTPTCATILAEVFHAAGAPPGVFNLVHGDGPLVGSALAAHPDVAMVSITGSTRAGGQVARLAADSIKRVTQELGGKSPFVVLPDADVAAATAACIEWILLNSGQSCSAPTRLLVPEKMRDDVVDTARKLMGGAIIGDPTNESTTMGPVVNRTQWDRVQRLIASGIAQGAKVACGGPGRPAHLDRGYYVNPTLFVDVTNDMEIAREEIFGPVLSILGYADEDAAVRIANDTPYGLAAYVSSGDIGHARDVARKLRAGNVNLNGAMNDRRAPFGGYKQSGNGREWGRFGLEEYLEVKAIGGWGD